MKNIGVDIPADRWPLEELDDHLKLRFAVVDGKDHELAAGRDISVLRQEFTEEEESQAFAKARRNWEKDGMTAWDFGELPRQITLTARGFNAAVAFPALALTEKGIGIRLFRSEAEACRAHRKGVRGAPGAAIPRRTEAPAQRDRPHGRSQALGGGFRRGQDPGKCARR